VPAPVKPVTTPFDLTMNTGSVPPLGTPKDELPFPDSVLFV